ncbi:APC family permease [Jeongeupia wiesaeckerbachi]|uniref:APC family permease n=1 Tax=Jeongeupia wiesaeckerbachi TaxID=3051218 RepID=UPI003D8054E1
MKNAFDILRLCAIAVGMAITISCNTVLVSLFPFAQGPSLWLALGFAGLCMAVIMLCFTELASRFPGAIGIRAFTKAAFGNRFSLAITLFYVVMMMMVGGLEGYLCFLMLQQVLSSQLAVIVLVGLILAVLVVNLRGYELSLNLQIVITVAVVAMMALLASMALAVPALKPPLSPISHSAEGLFAAVPRALFLFVGIEWAIMHVSRHDAFRRTLPIALMISVATIALLYGLFGSALQHHFNAADWGKLALPHLELARIIGSPVALWLATVIGVLAVLSSFNVGLSGAARILYSLAREREIPAWFAQLHGPRLSPRNAMLFISIGVLSMAPLMAMPVLNTSLSRLFSVHLVAVYALILLAWTKIRRQPDKRGIRQPLHPLVVWPTALFLAAIGIGVIAEPEAQLARLILLGEFLTIGMVCVYLRRPTLIKA